MKKQCLNISDESLIDKLEYFIYDVSEYEYNDLEIVLDYSLGNRNDIDYARNNLYKLREMTSYYSTDISLDEKYINDAIELFLVFLRTYNMEASVCLCSFLDLIWKTGKAGSEWRCVNRVCGILASIYMVYFSHKSKLFSKENTQKNMKNIFMKYIEFYTLEDRKFLVQIFLQEKQFDCILVFLRKDLVVQGIDEKIVVDSQFNLWNNFFKIIEKLHNATKYEDALLFFEESESLFRIMDTEVQGWWEREKALVLFYLGKYEDAKKIMDKYVDADTEDVYDLYDDAVINGWAANFKEKDDPAWNDYIDSAIRVVGQVEAILQSKDSKKQKYDIKLYYKVLFEKSFLLSEKEDYNEAYHYFSEAFSKAEVDNKKNSNFDTHLWILMKYMCVNPEKEKQILNWINQIHAHKEYVNKLGEYEPVVEFVNTNEYLKNNTKLYDGIYPNLLKLFFHAMEILHETKIRDISKYDILYYTKTEHLRLLLEDESDGKCHYRLPIFHACHMNDPQEGKILQDILGRNKSLCVDGKSVSENIYEENYVFLKSFFCYRKEENESNIKEFLPMWVQYGDDAKGCCVVLNNKTFENSKLRRIVYLSDEGVCGNKKIQKYLDDFKTAYQCLSELRKEIDTKSDQGRDCLLMLDSLVSSTISRISYLFKHDSYKHENEVRLIINRTSNNLDDVNVISGKIPKLYIYNDKQSYIDQIILGAKVENPEDYVPFIHKQGNKMWGENKESKIKVTNSMIQYR